MEPNCIFEVFSETAYLHTSRSSEGDLTPEVSVQLLSVGTPAKLVHRVDYGPSKIYLHKMIIDDLHILFYS